MERKLATVLFVDLVDSTSLVTGSDPEIVRRRVNQFFERVSRCVHTHGGIVEKFAGDAVMAAFGIPRAHEDDAERAVHAAWATARAVEELGRPPRGVSAPLVGRDEELELLANAYRRAVRDRRAHVFTIFGEPGIGK